MALKEKLQESCKKLVKKSLHLRPIDSVLVITDAGHREFYEAFCTACTESEVVPSVFLVPESLRPLRKVSNSLRQTLTHSTVVISALDYHISESQFRNTVSQLARQHSARVLNFPGLPVEGFSHEAFDVNPLEVASRASKVHNILSEVGLVEVSSPNGTKASFAPTAFIHENNSLEVQPGQALELPGGEVSVQPELSTLNGTIAVDFLAGHGLLKQPLKLTVESGEVKSVKGKEASFLEGVFAEDSNARKIGEFGLGMNHAAKVCETPYLAEKALGTCHFALGSSAHLGGNVISSYHIGLLLKSPTVKLDGRELVKDGKFLLD